MAATRTAPARRARPSTRPEARPTATPKRADLRVVRSAAARRRRLLTFAVTSFVVTGLSGVVAFHVLITQAQFELDALEEKAVVEQARYERLRLQVAELESPARIVAAAQERLGMVPPPGVRYLSPAGVTSGAAATATSRADDADDGADGRDAPVATAGGGWSTVKPHLGSRP